MAAAVCASMPKVELRSRFQLHQTRRREKEADRSPSFLFPTLTPSVAMRFRTHPEKTQTRPPLENSEGLPKELPGLRGHSPQSRGYTNNEGSHNSTNRSNRVSNQGLNTIADSTRRNSASERCTTTRTKSPLRSVSSRMTPSRTNRLKMTISLKFTIRRTTQK